MPLQSVISCFCIFQHMNKFYIKQRYCTFAFVLLCSDAEKALRCLLKLNTAPAGIYFDRDYSCAKFFFLYFASASISYPRSARITVIWWNWWYWFKSRYNGVFSLPVMQIDGESEFVAYAFTNSSSHCGLSVREANAMDSAIPRSSCCRTNNPFVL